MGATNLRVIYVVETTVVVIGSKDAKFDPISQLVVDDHIAVAELDDFLSIATKRCGGQAKEKAWSEGIQKLAVRPSSGVVKFVRNHVVLGVPVDSVRVSGEQLDRREMNRDVRHGF